MTEGAKTWRQRVIDDFRHAFAVEKPGPAEPSPEQAALVDRVCREVVRRRLTTPALVALEMSRPLNFVTAQLIHFFDPLLRSFGDVNAPREFATFLERRGSIDYLAKRIEELEAEAVRRPTP
ncbi:MAG: hypothetical protein M3552_07780 [Planctomycetota bacterium]|nr:hypothetical protein [Planctomycetaceae bacterium]MDQ3330537.1 hypothetical protein [Planctomycetota bacterium]